MLRWRYSLACLLCCQIAAAEEQPGDQDPPLPPPRAPTPTDQSPPPVREAPDELPPLRNILVGGFVGASQRFSGSGNVDYRPAVTRGAFARVELFSWLGLRLHYRRENIGVDVGAGAFGDHGQTSFHQPHLALHGLGARLEPTLELARAIDVSLMLGVEWARLTAKPPTSSGEADIATGQRDGVQLHYQAGLGLGVEVIRDWFWLGTSGNVGWFSNQSGTAFRNLQGIDQDGLITHLEPLPKFSHSVEWVLAAGLIL